MAIQIWDLGYHQNHHKTNSTDHQGTTDGKNNPRLKSHRVRDWSCDSGLLSKCTTNITTGGTRQTASSSVCFQLVVFSFFSSLPGKFTTNITRQVHDQCHQDWKAGIMGPDHQLCLISTCGFFSPSNGMARENKCDRVFNTWLDFGGAQDPGISFTLFNNVKERVLKFQPWPLEVQCFCTLTSAF